MQGLGDPDQLLVLDDLVGGVHHREGGAGIGPGDGLIALDGLHVGVVDGAAGEMEVSATEAERLTGWEGAIEDQAEAVPGGLVVEKDTGAELMRHGKLQRPVGRRQRGQKSRPRGETGERWGGASTRRPG